MARKAGGIQSQEREVFGTDLLLHDKFGFMAILTFLFLVGAQQLVAGQFMIKASRIKVDYPEIPAMMFAMAGCTFFVPYL